MGSCCLLSKFFNFLLKLPGLKSGRIAKRCLTDEADFKTYWNLSVAYWARLMRASEFLVALSLFFKFFLFAYSPCFAFFLTAFLPRLPPSLQSVADVLIVNAPPFRS